MTKLKELLNRIETKVKDDFDKNGEISLPLWFLENDEGLVIVATPFNEVDSKDAAAAAVRKIIAEKGIDRYLFVCETWFVSEKPDKSSPWKTNYTAPSQHPNRKEAVLISGEDRHTEESIFFMHEIDRSGEKPVLKLDTNKMDSASKAGRFTDMFGKYRKRSAVN